MKNQILHSSLKHHAQWGANKIKYLLFLLFGISLSGTASAEAHVTMSLKNIRTSSNTISYDLYILNDGCTSINLSACSYGVNFNPGIINGGKLTYTYEEQTRSESLKGLTTFALAQNTVNGVSQLRMTSSPANVSSAPELTPNIPFKIGSFKITNSVAWTPNSSALFSLQEINTIGLTVTQIVGYINHSNLLTALTPKMNGVATYVEEMPILNPQSNSSGIDINTNSKNHDESLSIPVEQVVRIYPNPAHERLNMDYHALLKGSINIYIHDIHGRLLKQIETIVLEGINTVEISLDDISQGLYTISVKDSHDFSYSQSFSRQ